MCSHSFLRNPRFGSQNLRMFQCFKCTAGDCGSRTLIPGMLGSGKIGKSQEKAAEIQRCCSSAVHCWSVPEYEADFYTSSRPFFSPGHPPSWVLLCNWGSNSVKKGEGRGLVLWLTHMNHSWIIGLWIKPPAPWFSHKNSGFCGGCPCKENKRFRLIPRTFCRYGNAMSIHLSTSPNARRPW